MVKLFSYGSNSSKQLGRRLGVDPDSLTKESGYLLGHIRIFGGFNERCGGGVASILQHHSNARVYGSIFNLTMNQIKMVDQWEIGYIRKKMSINIDKNISIKAYVYVMVDPTYIAPPSNKYLNAIRIMLDETPRGAKSKIDINIVEFGSKIKKISST